jgi:hypothetical protein
VSSSSRKRGGADRHFGIFGIGCPVLSTKFSSIARARTQVHSSATAKEEGAPPPPAAAARRMEPEMAAALAAHLAGMGIAPGPAAGSASRGAVAPFYKRAVEPFYKRRSQPKPCLKLSTQL